MVRQHDDGRRTDETAVLAERVEIERDVCQRRRQNAARRAAWEIRVERVTVLHPSAVLVDELLQRDTCRREVDTRPLDAPTYREVAESVAAMAAMARNQAGATLDVVAVPVQSMLYGHQEWAYA